MTSSSNEAWERLCALAHTEMRIHHIPGACIGISIGSAMHCAGLGVTSLDHPLPVDVSTLFQIGSITKTFTSAAAMRLVEAGRLQLQARVVDLLPTWRVADDLATATATVWHLLTHTGGWQGDMFLDTGPGEDALARYVAAMAGLPQVCPVGLHYSYNNAGFALLGRLLEVIETRPFEQLIADSLLRPLGLAHVYFKAEDVVTKRFAVGHQVLGDSAQVATPWALPRYAAPMGGLVTCLEDLLTYARMWLAQGRTAKGEQLLTPATVHAMQAPQSSIWQDREAIGLAWHIERHGGLTLVSHGGGTVGQGAFLEFCPGRDFALAILANADTASAFVRSLRKAALQEYLEIDLPEDQTIPMTNAQMLEMEGRYVLPRLGYTEIRILGGKLVAQDINTGGFPTEDTPPEPNPPPYTLEQSERDRLVIADGKYKGMVCDILRDETGRMQWLRMGGRIHFREPIPDYR
jgi:CubicO group peptidase (beta-lactamase class C family)